MFCRLHVFAAIEKHREAIIGETYVSAVNDVVIL